MKIFLSWSGAHSRAVAAALNDWLKRIIQATKPFYSPDIEKGANWSNELDAALEGTRFGIICLTPDNLASPWIHYEAGALSKTSDALIWTYLHGVEPGNVRPPLGKFQHTIANQDDTLLLLRSINKRLADTGGDSLSDKILEEDFIDRWPKLEEKLKIAESFSDKYLQATSTTVLDKTRNDREILQEVLELLRAQQRQFSSSHSLPSQFIFDHPRKITVHHNAEGMTDIRSVTIKMEKDKVIEGLLLSGVLFSGLNEALQSSGITVTNIARQISLIKDEIHLRVSFSSPIETNTLINALDLLPPELKQYLKHIDVIGSPAS